MLSRADVQSLLGRVLINLESTAGAFYELSQPFSPSGDFEVEVDFFTTTTSEVTLFGKSSDARGFLRLDGGRPSINFTVATGSNQFGSTNFADGLLHTLKLTLNSGVVQVFVDNVILGSATPTDVSNINFDNIGSKSGSAFFNGIISNVKLTDLSTPANSLTFGLNELTSNTEINNGVTLTYNNIAQTEDVRDTYGISKDGTQLISNLRTINIANQA